MKQVAIAYDDGRVDMIDEETINVARALEAAAKDPEIGPIIKVLVTQLMFHDAKVKAAQNPHG